MMKVALVCTFLLALTYSVSADKINCYLCVEGDFIVSPAAQKLKAFLARDNLPVPTDKCLDPVDNSTTTEVDTATYSCAKIDASATLGDKTAEGTIRMAIPKESCPTIEDSFGESADAAKVDDYSIDCYECTEDKCNLASTAQVSILMLLAPALAYLMRS